MKMVKKKTISHRDHRGHRDFRIFPAILSVFSVSSVAKNKLRFLSSANRRSSGSALLLAVVLASLLAVIGALFLMTSRIERMGTTAIAENKDLDSAIDSVVAAVSRQLILDTPGVRANEEYYDYPDVNNPWLANLEPNEIFPVGSNNYCWRRISDITGLLNFNGFPTTTVPAVIVSDTTPINLTFPGGPLADADGDGVSDSKWIQLNDMTSGKGKTIYAAVRVIDNGAMLNVNTAYQFDPNSQQSNRVDGSKQTQINLMALSGRDNTHINYPEEKQSRLDLRRCGYGEEPNDISVYEENVLPYYNPVKGKYTPFDMSDELKLRNRFFLNNNNITTRIEGLWTKAYDWWLGGVRTDDNSFTTDPDYWFCRINNSSPDPCVYDYRHISTTYNMDRIITPVGERMLNVNAASASVLSSVFTDPNLTNPLSIQEATQLAVNIADCTDNDLKENVDENVTVYNGYYGFERPCIFISELAFYFKDVNDSNGNPETHRSYAIELRKRYPAQTDDQYRLEIFDPSLTRSFGLSETQLVYPYLNGFDSDNRRYCVLRFEDPCVPLNNDVIFSDSPEDGETGVDPRVTLRWPTFWADDGSDPNWSYDVYFGTDANNVRDANNNIGLWAEYMGSRNNRDFNDLSPLDLDTTYYWRIDDVYDGNVISPGGKVWKFTTWTQEPNTLILPALNPKDPNDVIFRDTTKIRLYRRTTFGTDLLVDEVDIGLLPQLVDISGASKERKSVSCQRDIDQNRFIKRLWDLSCSQSPTLGHYNTYSGPATNPIQVRFGRFTNIGEIGMVFKEHMYADNGSGVGIGFNAEDLTEYDVRLNLAKPLYQPLFRYLTRFDPAADGIDNDGDGNTVNDNIITQTQKPEWKIPGRININTAPWYVIAQLPWVSQKSSGTIDFSLAQAIVAYRDKLPVLSQAAINYGLGRESITGLTGAGLRETPGFASIGELTTVINNQGFEKYDMHYYSLTTMAGDQVGFPDITTTNSRTRDDGAPDDFEERDLIFARISDLVTVRSDVFTAYILVRIGVDGPQKRAVAILDRSDVYPDGGGGVIGKVKIRALHLVPDPR